MQTGNLAVTLSRLAGWDVLCSKVLNGVCRGLGAVLALVVLGATPANAQYVSPGVAGRTDAIPDKDSLDENIKNSRWNAGAVRLSPWIGLRDASLVSNQGQDGATEEDFTVTAGAGLRAYLPTGKVIWSAQALPEYVWWEDDEDKRGLNGRYGLGLFGYFNRLRLEVSQRLDETQGFFSAEVQELTTNRIETSRFAVEVEVARRLEVYGSASLRNFTNEEDGQTLFTQLDREEEKLAVGVRYRTPRGWTLGLGFEDQTTDLEETGRNLSNSGTSEIFELGYEGSQINFRLALQARDLEADDGSDFGVFDETTGSLEALWNPSGRSTVLGYARRSQSLSVDTLNAFFLAERQGVRFNFSSDRSRFGVFAEVGEDEFERIDPTVAARIDDTTAFGADIELEVGDLFRVRLSAIFTDYDSNLDGFDRDVTTIGFGVQLGSLVDRLRLGQAEGNW